MQETGVLSIVATPIGNLEDITLRAVRVLKEANVVACEDTRNTSKLLSHFEIQTPTVSFHAHSGEKGFAKIISFLKEGKRVALVSDAGTPGISDPGQELISVVRETLPLIKIETIPGASALSATLAIAGMRVQSFVFYGFLPLKKGRETIMKEIATSERASIFYESPHRIHKSVKLLITFLQAREEQGAKISDRRVGIFRELTKLHEESFVGTPQEALHYLESDANHQRGEFVVVIEGKK
jgi:16S rRNA (cytidine1402-2'-O)-methyltransferase